MKKITILLLTVMLCYVLLIYPEAYHQTYMRRKRDRRMCKRKLYLMETALL